MSEVTDTLQNNRVEAFEKACRESGLRLTHQRLEIFRELAAAHDHPSAETLHRRLLRTMPTLSLDTVYRTLATLAAHGIINRVETVQSQARFEVRDEGHHHLICSRCNRIMDFQWGALECLLLPDELSRWGRVESRSVVVYGVCNACLGGGM